MRAQTPARPSLRLVPPPGPAETVLGLEIGTWRRQGGDRDEGDAAAASLLALIARLRPDLPVDQAAVEVAETLAEFDARCAALEDAQLRPKSGRWREFSARVACFVLLAGPPLVGGGGAGVLVAIAS